MNFNYLEFLSKECKTEIATADFVSQLMMNKVYEKGFKDACLSSEVIPISVLEDIEAEMLKYGFTAPDMTVTEFVEDILPSVYPKSDKFNTVSEEVYTQEYLARKESDMEVFKLRKALEDIKAEIIHSIAKQYSEHNEIVPAWLSIGDISRKKQTGENTDGSNS